MKVFSRLNRYILKETAITYFFTVASFLFLMYTATFLKQMEMGLPLSKIIMHSPYIFFINLPFVLPLGLITGYILTFSRLAVDREIQIIRCSGIPLSRIIVPHLVLGLLMSFVAGYAFLEWIPQVRKNFQQKLVSIFREIPPVTETYNKPSLLLNRKRDRINVTARDGSEIKGLAIQHVENGRLTQVTFAEKARIYRRTPELLRFEMEKVSRLVIKEEYIDHPRFAKLSIDVPLISSGADMAAGNQYDTRTGLELQHFARDKSNDKHDRRWAQIEFWLRISQAMACFAFTIFAIPSGILSSQKSKASGFIISILYALVIFFPMIMGLRSFLHSPVGYGFHPNLMLLPNWVFIFYGAWLLRKVMRQ